jgi:glycosyltransferase involved in cell wall biosynthesis
MSLTYAAITPARDEPANLRRLAACLSRQTLLPTTWVIVDNGSSDDTVEVARAIARDHDWVGVLEVAGDPRARPGAPIVRAFHAGLHALDALPDVIVKLDADVSFDDDYFARLVGAFEQNPSLGIASGTCLELEGGRWLARPVTGDHVRGATRAYRKECLREVLPLEERVGWDGIDELKAAVLGWQTCMLQDIEFRHHREMGARDGSRQARWQSLGSAAYYMDYRFSYLLLRSLHWTRRDPAAVAMITSYLGALVRREPRYGDETVRAYLRRQQRLREVPRRALEALGRRP